MIEWSRAGRRRVGQAIAGDCLVILAVLAVGIVRHGGVEGLFDLARVADTVAPFLLAWLILAPVSGVYRESVLRDRRQAIGRVLGAWIGAALLGSAIRATPAFSGGATPIFVLVVAGTGAAAILTWRLLYHAVATDAQR